MPRIRTVKPEFWSDEKLSPLPPITRLTFLGLISMADDAGRLLDNVKVIDAFVFPETRDSCRDAIEELIHLGRLQRGLTASGQKVIQIAKWDDHQKIDRPSLKMALPPIASHFRKKIPDSVRDAVWLRDGKICQACGRANLRRDKRDKYDGGDDLGEIDHVIDVADGGGNLLDNLRLLCQPCNRKKQGQSTIGRNSENARRKLDEGSSSHTNDLVPTTTYQSAPAPPSPDEWFELAWSAYPKRPNNSKADARKAFLARLNQGADPALIVDGVERYAAFVVAAQTEPKFIKQAATFFGPGRWWESDFDYTAPPTAADLEYAKIAAEAADVGRMSA